jgi:predicted nucleic acid-binding protein
MSFVLTYEDALHESFQQASIYIDACFILAYMNSDDSRGDKVCQILEKWHGEGITKLGISSHVFGEVVHNLFIQEILLPLEIYHKKQLNPRLKSHPDYQLGKLEESVSFLYGVWRKVIPRFYKKDFNVNISDLIKSVKTNYPSQRSKLQIFYNNAIDRYNEFLSGIRNDFTIEFLDTNSDIQDLALSQMRLLQLEAYDALHYAIAMYNGYDYFATLDGDFVHNLYGESPTTRIVKIA